MSEEEEKARMEAQARRERILNRMNDRLDIVSGIPSTSTSAAGGDGEDANGTNEVEDAPSKKLAAMRRRRFKKKEKTDEAAAAAAGGVETENASPEEKDGATEEGAAVPSDEVTANECPAPATSVPAPAAVTEQAVPAENVSETQKPADEDVVEEFNTPGVEREEEAKKKYMGVAKMRRQMLREKKLQEQQDTTGAATTATATKTTRAVSGLKKSAVQIKADRVAIAMHVLIVVLLFLAGFDVGMQGNLPYTSSSGVVHTGLAPRELKFLDILPGFIREKKVAPIVIKDDLVKPQKVIADDATVSSEEDEFGEGKPHVVNEDNIDPLFGVDLDKLTAGPGLYMSVSRIAIKLHRVNLALFYYGPKALWRSILSFLTSLALIPPILGLIAMFLRQGLGNNVLGAHLPQIVQDDVQQAPDVLNTAANFVKNFLSNLFPNAINFYKGWVLLRADMYVVVCGLFVGLAWQHSKLVQSSVVVTPDRDEL